MYCPDCEEDGITECFVCGKTFLPGETIFCYDEEWHVCRTETADCLIKLLKDPEEVDLLSEAQLEIEDDTSGETEEPAVIDKSQYGIDSSDEDESEEDTEEEEYSSNIELGAKRRGLVR